MKGIPAPTMTTVFEAWRSDNYPALAETLPRLRKRDEQRTHQKRIRLPNATSCVRKARRAGDTTGMAVARMNKAVHRMTAKKIIQSDPDSTTWRKGILGAIAGGCDRRIGRYA